MPFLDAYAGVRRVTIGDTELGYYIDLKEHVSYHAREDAEKALSRVVMNGAMPEMRPDTTRYRQLMLLAHIDSWNLDDEDGIWPLTLDSVKRLPGDVFDRVWMIVDNIADPVQDAAERRRFPDRGVERDQERDDWSTVAE